MNVTFYQNNSDNRACKKNLTQVGSANCQLLDAVSVQNPSLRVRMSALTMGCNYCYIPDFGRYYYIASKTIYDGECYILSLKCDVLMSFYNNFANSPCIAKRSSSNYDNMLPDNYVVKKPTSTLVFRRLGSGFTPSASSGSYVLTVGGK